MLIFLTFYRIRFGWLFFYFIFECLLFLILFHVVFLIRIGIRWHLLGLFELKIQSYKFPIEYLIEYVTNTLSITLTKLTKQVHSQWIPSQSPTV